MPGQTFKVTEYAQPVKSRRFPVKFHGEGLPFFKMKFVQALLIILTCGIYWPWARAATLKYIYGNTEFAGNRFAFHGTGREMFIGLLKALAVFGIFFLMFMSTAFVKDRAVAALLVLCAYAGIFMVIPLALYGSMRYRYSRTSWRGIRFGYAGTLRELYALFIKGALLTVITFGIYGPFFQVRLRRCLLGNVRFGTARFEFTGEGGDFFWLLFKGGLFSTLTLGIYSFWFMADRFNFMWGNIDVDQEGRKSSFLATMTAGKLFGFILPAFLLTVVTLGVAYPWVRMWRIRLFTDNVELAGEFDPDALVQGAADRIGAAGEELGSILDIDSGMMFG
jgi:uncharacterized membrane protein YjgN (DUF898 family)